MIASKGCQDRNTGKAAANIAWIDFDNPFMSCPAPVVDSRNNADISGSPCSCQSAAEVISKVGHGPNSLAAIRQCHRYSLTFCGLRCDGGTIRFCDDEMSRRKRTEGRGGDRDKGFVIKLNIFYIFFY